MASNPAPKARNIRDVNNASAEGAKYTRDVNASAEGAKYTRDVNASAEGAKYTRDVNASAEGAKYTRDVNASAEGAKYDSQGQAPNNVRRVAPGHGAILLNRALKVRNINVNR